MSNTVAATLKEGDPAPDFRLETDRAEPFQLSTLKGKNVVLYFYPRADTPGCTTEACGFRDSAREFSKHDAVIIGISPDAIHAQSKFKSKYGLPFTLVCDVNKAVAQAYGACQEKSMYGRKVLGIERTTFLIGKDGAIKRVFSKVKPHGHSGEVLEALSAL